MSLGSYKQARIYFKWWLLEATEITKLWNMKEILSNQSAPITSCKLEII